MNRRPLILAAAIALAAAVNFSGCRTAGGYLTRDELPTPTSAAGMSSADIAGAQQLYIAKCARCHKFYDPSRYDDAESKSWMMKMSRKARLNSDEETLLTHYIEALRNGNRPVGDSLR